MLSTIGLIIDIAIVLALIICGIIGLRKGFLHSIISVFSWGLCLVIAFLTAKYVAGWINGIFDFAGLIGDKIADGLIKSNEFFAQSINTFEAGGTEALIAAIPENTNGLLKQLIKVVFSNSAVDMTSSDSIGSVVGSGLGQIIMIVIAGILVFVVLKIAVALLGKLFDSIARTKVLGGLNKILGLLLGVVKAGIIVIGLNVLLVALSLIPAVNKTMNPLIKENTTIEKVIYNKTDELFGKYIVEGELLENWVNDLWENRE